MIKINLVLFVLGSMVMSSAAMAGEQQKSYLLCGLTHKQTNTSEPVDITPVYKHGKLLNTGSGGEQLIIGGKATVDAPNNPFIQGVQFHAILDGPVFSMQLIDGPRSKNSQIIMPSAALYAGKIDLTFRYRAGELFLEPAKFGWPNSPAEPIAKLIFSCRILKI